MDSFLNTEKLFRDEDFSDVVVRYSGKEIKCHKIILCTKSDYFKKLCRPGSRFKESKTDVVELKEDDPDAVEAVLWYIYSGKTESSRSNDWLHHLHVSKAAEKYLLPELESQAFERFQKATHAITRPDVVLSAIHTIREVGDHPKHLQVADKLEEKHHSALLKDQEYRSIVEGDKELLWKHMDRLNFADDLVKMEVVKCDYCDRARVRAIGSRKSPRPPCNYQEIHGILRVASCWMSKADAEKLY